MLIRDGSLTDELTLTPTLPLPLPLTLTRLGRSKSSGLGDSFSECTDDGQSFDDLMALRTGQVKIPG